MRIDRRLCMAGLLLSITATASAHPGAHHQRGTQAPVAAAVAPVVLDALGTASALSAALAGGDAARVMVLLAEDAVIYESGGQDSSRAEYAAHHLQADIAFLAGMKMQLLERKQGGSGDMAWVITRSRLSGSHKGKALDLYSTESLVLQRVAGTWRIVHGAVPN